MLKNGITMEKKESISIPNGIRCKRCGKCCIIEGTPCRYLSYFRNGTTYCKIWNRRIGAFTGIYFEGEKVYCKQRQENIRIIEGCPYNEERRQKE